MEPCECYCLGEASVADAAGGLPESLWRPQSHFHTHHLLPTASICDSLASGFPWPQERAWPIQGTGPTFGGVNTFHQERIEIQCMSTPGLPPHQRGTAVGQVLLSLPEAPDRMDRQAPSPSFPLLSVILPHSCTSCPGITSK